jgi:hypothetical protein
MSELTTVLEERKKQRYEILEKKIKELEAIKKNYSVNDVDDIGTKDLKNELEILVEHMEEKIRHYKKNVEMLKMLHDLASDMNNL